MLVLGGVQGKRRGAVCSVCGGDVQGRDWERSVLSVSVRDIRRCCQLQCVHELRGEYRVSQWEHSREQLRLRTGLLGGCRQRGDLFRVSYWNVQGLCRCCGVLRVPGREPPVGPREHFGGGLRRGGVHPHVFGDAAAESSRVRG